MFVTRYMAGILPIRPKTQNNQSIVTQMRTCLYIEQGVINFRQNKTKFHITLKKIISHFIQAFQYITIQIVGKTGL